MDPVLTYVLLLSNCGLIIRGFSLRSCFLSEDNRAFCAQHSLRSVPTDIPPNVKGINLRNNIISEIQVSNFTSFPNVTSLDLSQNHVSVIGRRTFSQLVSLQQLILSRNKLIKLEDDVFDGLATLLELRLDFNQIKTVAQNAFRSLSSLKLLELSHNKLQSIAKVHFAVQHMPQLRVLMIRNNVITTFRSQDLTNISTKITSLDISENPLVKFEVTADVFPNLKNLSIGSPTRKSNLTWSVQKRSLLRHVTTLDISAVQLESIDKWRELLTAFTSSLRFLKMDSSFTPSALINMSCSLLTLSKLQVRTSNLSISSSLFQTCKNITTLDLTENAMRQIESGSLRFLYRLQVLLLTNNSFSVVPSGVRHLPSLQTLDLAENQIRTLRCQDFTGLTGLTELRLQRNKIAALNNCTFAHLSKLEGLLLHGNLILELGSTFRNGLPKLNYLSLNQNKLTKINENAFKGLRSLTKLDLAKNQIATLQKGSFSGLTSLTILQLNSNELKTNTLRKNVFNGLFNLKKLHLENNHLNYGSSSPVKDPPFLNLSRLETLIFQKQTWQSMQGHIPSNFLQGLTGLLSLSCNNLQVFNFSESFFTHTPRLTNLDISYNSLQDLSPKLFAPISNLTRLRISSNSFQSMDFLINGNLTNLKFLKARKTPFSVIREDLIKSLPSLIDLDLTQNSFTCDCDNSWFVQWIQNNNQTQVQGAHSFRCNSPPQRRNTRLLDLNVQSCLVDIGFICFICSTCVNVLTLVASFTFHFSRFHLKYAYYLFLAWLYDSRNRQKRAACHYDAFVSYNAHDEAWVYRELVPHLEQEQGWRLCLHHRDFIPGKPIVDNITEAIYGSRKTLCVVSRRYLQSEWCSKEMQLASFRLFDEREDVLILVFLEDIPSSHVSPYYRMKRLLKRRSYLSWPRAAQHPQLFWEKLRQALRSTDTEEEDRLCLTVAQ